MNPKKISWYITLLLFLCGITSAEVLRVPWEYTTIQSGIDAAVDGDTVLVADGTYTGEGNRDLQFNGKSILVLSENGPENCIIDCELISNYGVNFNSNETFESVFSGFTVINAKWFGIISNCASPIIHNCVIRNQSDDLASGGVGCFGGNPQISWSTIHNNHETGIMITESANVTINHCVIDNNSGDFQAGGGIFVDGESEVTIENSSITNNSCMSGGAGIDCENSILIITGSEINANDAHHGSGIMSIRSNSDVVISDCDLQNNSAFWNGGITCNDSSLALYRSRVYSNHGMMVDGSVNASNSNVDVIWCKIYNNSGGIYHSDSNIDIYNSLIHENSICGLYSSNGTLNINESTIAGNTGNGGFDCYGNCELTIINSVIWGNTGNQIRLNDTATASVSFSDIEDGYPGDFNQDVDPTFVTGEIGDFYLSQPPGQSESSICVDSGSNTSDTLGFDFWGEFVLYSDLTTSTEGQSDTGTIDMGYHYPIELTPTPTSTITPVPYTPTMTPEPITPSPSPTQTCTAQPSVTATPSPECGDLGVTINMPLDSYHPGCNCYCTVTVCNPTDEILSGIPLFVVLDAYGMYYFAPSFNEFDYYDNVTFDHGETVVPAISSFTWPEACGSGECTLYAAMTNPEITEIYGIMDSKLFTWEM